MNSFLERSLLLRPPCRSRHDLMTSLVTWSSVRLAITVRSYSTPIFVCGP